MTAKQFTKILIANRGEIAIRVARTAHQMGYQTVAVYSDADRDALHVATCSQAVRIGPAEAARSYLDIAAIMAAARDCGADAVHPGYGFLSENAAFARACEEAGLTFIGPPPSAIAAMGNKAAAKARMIAAGVPCVPGFEGVAQDDDRLIAEARRIGLPVMIKAAAGGGGRGMRLVADEPALGDAIRSARSEALNAFGSGELIIEKAIVDGRHIEIQVFADGHGNVIHLGERDCSVQRRHQKVIEEAPSPAVGAELRAAMGAAAVSAARAIGYRGAGTVEFMLGADGSYYFLEMNTRLQVEHPVTEAITGLDLVEWQIRVARGEPLPLMQDQVRSTGAAIEVRLYAEAPAQGFLPQSGEVLAWVPPRIAGVRVDHGLKAIDRVSPHYDPMIAKLIGSGSTRDEARIRLIAALRETVVLGIATNRDFLIDLLSHPDFAAGVATTSFIGGHFNGWAQPAAQDSRELAILAALLLETSGECHGGSLAGWSSTGAAAAPLRMAVGERTIDASLSRPAAGWHVEIAGAAHDVAVLVLSPGIARIDVDGRQVTVRFSRDHEHLHAAVGPTTLVAADMTRRPTRRGDGAGDSRMLAPMNGKVVRVLAKAGDSVGKGQCIVVLEAMKMQHEIVAARAGTLAAVPVSVGQQVATRALLAELAD